MFHCVLVGTMEPTAHPAGQDGGPMVVPPMQSPSGQGELNCKCFIPIYQLTLVFVQLGVVV